MKKTKLLSLFALGIVLGCATLFRANTYDVQNDVVFKTTETKSLTADLFIPKKEKLHPAVIVVHGGSWTKKNGDMESICKDLAAEGFVAMNTSYRFAPQDLYPKAVEDVRDAILWLKQNAQKFKVDPEKIYLWGYSAGGHLALMASLDGTLGVKAVVAGGTPANLTAWPNSPLVKTFLGVSYAENPQLWEAASPSFHVTEKSPPVFMYHGAWDRLVEPEQMDMMAEALREKNREIKTYRIPLLGHIAVYLLSFSSVSQAIEFIKAH
jgi:acetyl esterase/lipase